MTLEDCYGLLFLGYFALIISAGIAVFERAGVMPALIALATLASPLILLMSLAIRLAALEPADAC